MNEKEKRILIEWARDEETFLDEIIERAELHKKILKERVKMLMRKRI